MLINGLLNSLKGLVWHCDDFKVRVNVCFEFWLGLTVVLVSR